MTPNPSRGIPTSRSASARRCRQCDRDNAEDAKFCDRCGAVLGRVCPACDGLNRPDSRFCEHCGHALVMTLPPDAGRELSMARRAMTTPTAREGERKHVTVLFADLKGSMELLAGRDPEDARRVIDPVLERMIEAVQHYGGTVNQVMGDGIMALFGAPFALEDHAIRACCAALRIQDAMRRLADVRHVADHVPLRIRIGINSGEVLARAIGTGTGTDYSPIGETTHLGARMEQMAEPGSILLTAETLRLAAGYIVTRALGERRVKGRVDPLAVYELTGVTPARSRFDLAAARGLTGFTGRTDELAQLRQALRQTRDGRGQVVGVVGDPGVGKSRVCWELERSADVGGWLVLHATGASHGRSIPYLPIVSLLRAYFELESHHGSHEILGRMTSKLLARDPALAADLPPLASLLDVPSGDREWDTLDPARRRQRIVEAVKSLIFAESRAQPVLVLVEDLHWVDHETLALLDSLVDGVAAARVLLLVTYRPEWRHAWGGKSYYRQVRIDPLASEHCEALLRSLLGAHPDLRPVMRRLAERAEGNPLFLEECVRVLVERGVLSGSAGSYRVARDIRDLELPASVHAILAARIDRLADDDKRVLQAASVIGRVVPEHLLAAVRDSADPRTLDRLQEAEFLYETRRFPEREFTFKHPLTHEVAYNAIPHDRRRAMHARVAVAMETLYGDRLTEHVERLSDHALAGELWDKAVGYLRRAGVRAALRSASHDAAGRFEAALRALERLPQSPSTVQRAIGLRFDLRNPLFVLADFPRTIDVLSEVVRIAESEGESKHVALACAYMANAYFMLGQIGRGEDLAERARALAASLPEPSIDAITHCALGQLAYATGRYDDAVALLGHSVDALAGPALAARIHLVRTYSVVAHCFRALALAELGCFSDALESAEHCLALARRTETPFVSALAFWARGSVELTRGAVATAVDWLAQAERTCEASELRAIYPWIAADLGAALVSASRTDEAIGVLKATVARADELKLLSQQSLRLTRLAEAYQQAGRRGEAINCAERALALASQLGERGFLAHALRARAALVPAPLDGVPYLERALIEASDLDMRPLAARCHEDLGRLYASVRDRARARRFINHATALYAGLEMPLPLARTSTSTDV